MRFLQPDSFPKLLAVGFAMVALPLIFALINNAVSINQFANRSQRALHQRGLAMRAHQHRDITRLHRAPTQHRFARTRLDQGLVDRSDAGLGRCLTRGIGTHRLVTPAAQHAQGECLGGVAVVQIVLIGAHATGTHPLELDVRLEEGVLTPVVVQRLKRAQH